MRDTQQDKGPFQAAIFSVWTIGIGVAFAVTALVLIALAGANAGANHDDIACNDDVPSGYSCIPLVNKPQSGPGVTSPAIGELLYLWVDADTLRIAIRALPSSGAVDDSSTHQLCLDDDPEPYSEGSIGASVPSHCTGAGAAAVNVTDGSTGIPDSSLEPDDDSAAGLDGEYEVRISGMVGDGTVDGLPFYDFNNADGYTYFAFHVNIGDASTQAFWTGSAPPSSTPSPTASPTASATPTPSPSSTDPATASPTQSPSPSATDPATATPTQSPTSSATSPVTSSPTASATSSPTSTPTVTLTAPPTVSPTVVTSESPPATPTTTPTATPTATPTTPPVTASPSPTAQQATQTPAPTENPTPTTEVSTNTPAPSATVLGETSTPADFPDTGGPAASDGTAGWWLMLVAAVSFLIAGGMGLAATRVRLDN